MNRKLSIIAVVILLGGAIAVAIIKSRGGSDPVAGGAGDGGSGTGNSAAASGGAGGSGGKLAPEEAKSGERRGREVKDAALAEKYGGARTGLSRHASENVVSLLEDAVAVGEMMANGAFGGQMALGGLLRGTGIELTAEQREKAVELQREFQRRELEKGRDTINALKKDPLPLMELFLAGDAKERGEMSDDEYARVQDEAAERLIGVINPLDRDNFRGREAWQDETFRAGFEPILDDEQREKWDTSLAEREAKKQESAQKPTDISSLPTMELETLDQAIGSAKQMTSGFKQLIEGMGSLQELQPKIQGQPEGAGE